MEYRGKTGNPLAPKTIRHHYSTLNLIFEYAERLELIERNPMARVPAPKKDRKPVEAFTQEQAKEFIRLVEVLLVEATPVPVEELDSLAEAQQYIAQIEGLQADALLKDKVIEDLNNSNSSLQTTVDTQAATIQKQATDIEKLKKTKKIQRRAIIFLVIAFILLTLMVFSYLIIHDAPNPEYGILPSFFADQTAGLVEEIYTFVNL